MTKFADQLDKQNLINLALEKYEKTKRSKLPSVVVNLTSRGKIYPETHPLHSGKIEMRHMTAYDEDILTNISYIRENILFDKLLEALIVSDVSIADIAPADKDGLIINARILAYGANYPVVVIDPKTKKELQETVDLSKIKTTNFDLTPDSNGEFSYEINDTQHIKFSYMKFRILNDTKISELLQTVITQVGDSRKPDDIENFIRYEFLAIDSKKFRTFLINNQPALDLTYEFEGEDGSTFNAGFPIGADLFWF